MTTFLSWTLAGAAALVFAAIRGADPRDSASLEAQLSCDPRHVSGLQSLSHVRIGVPRIAEAPISWECRLFRLLDISVGNVSVIDRRQDQLQRAALRADHNVDAARVS